MGSQIGTDLGTHVLPISFCAAAASKAAFCRAVLLAFRQSESRSQTPVNSVSTIPPCDQVFEPAGPSEDSIALTGISDPGYRL